MLPKDFKWAVGIENTFVTQIEKGERPLDEYELTQHYENWESDLDLVRKTGVGMIRYGIPWYTIEKKPNEFDWEWTDKVMRYFKSNVELTPIIDLIHYGTPHWLEDEFSNPSYPEVVARFAKAFAERYGSFIKYYTPMNEPYVTAEFCGLNAVWPPYLEGLSGFYQIMTQAGKGIILTQKAIHEVVPDAVFIHVDATKRYHTDEARLETEMELWNENRFVMWELIQGRIVTGHPLYDWMISYGTAPETLDWFSQHPVQPDIVGLNYYPQFSVHAITRDNKGSIIFPNVMGTGSDLTEIAEEAYKRYGKPIMITETSFNGSEDERLSWLNEVVDSCEKMISNQLPVMGLTWFPFFDLVDWGYRTSDKTVEEELLPFGLYTLAQADGKLVRKKNRVADEFVERIRYHRGGRL
ncbi:family 1 glycosylhydrolase [Alkalibacterium pelagium]|uniref:Beta-glucosidase/6-phospho-beta-glucosidase/beta-galactosidase n=1 Tax=Alkalibacterium pelagium TaxID=426702 RepID=A0A1H7HQF4_9LACT|nr:family 1 glycosylhydrolase [Alkalibacterium pelagium]GEN50404.1 beta-glucosidase [Alkalibacterium pelagium]SEK51270.1 Beta-glucosidase/6-phospho-beta-glucosidase/beta-galactosidase [Alkalibacterium pelagium]